MMPVAHLNWKLKKMYVYTYCLPCLGLHDKSLKDYTLNRETAESLA